MTSYQPPVQQQQSPKYGPTGQQYSGGYQPQQKHVTYAPNVQTKTVNQSGSYQHASSVQKIQQKFNNPSSPVGPSQQQKYPQGRYNNQYGSGPASPASYNQQAQPYSPSPASVPKPQYNSPSSNGYGQYNSTASPVSIPARAYTQSAPVSPRVSLDLSKNYNTAARGWTQMNDYYRPIHLDGNSNRRAPVVQYTDF